MTSTSSNASGKDRVSSLISKLCHHGLEELLGIQDVGDGTVSYCIAEVVANGGEDEVCS